jgi:hypothetical protein
MWEYIATAKNRKLLAETIRVVPLKVLGTNPCAKTE